MFSKRSIERALLLGLLFSLPLQTRILLFSGGRPPIGGDEWRSVFLYASDIILVLLLTLGFLNSGALRRASWKFRFPGFSAREFSTLGVFVLLLAIGVLVRHPQASSWYHLIKVGEGVLLFQYVIRRLPA